MPLPQPQACGTQWERFRWQKPQPCPCLLHPAPNVVPKLPKAKKAFYFSITYLSLLKTKPFCSSSLPISMGRSSGPLIPKAAP